MKRILFRFLIMIISVGFVFSQSITVTNPHSGDTFYKGKTCNITWNYTGDINKKEIDKYVKIRAFLGSVKTVITNKTLISDKSFSWKIPQGLPEGKYYIRIKTTDNAVFGNGNLFTIKGGSSTPPAPITVKKPNSGDTLIKGKKYGITWLDPDFLKMLTPSMLDNGYLKNGMVDISLFDSSGIRKILTIGERKSPAYGIFQCYWNVPKTLPNGNYIIRIKNLINGGSGDSEVFKIADPQSGKITVTSPNRNSTWYMGGKYTIKWNKTGSMNDRVRICLYDAIGLTRILKITDNTANNGNFSWTIPNSNKNTKLTKGGEYVIIVKTIDGVVWGAARIKISSALNQKTIVLLKEMYKNRPKIKMIQGKLAPPNIKIITPKEGDIISPDTDVVVIKWKNINFKSQNGQTAQINLINVDKSLGKIIANEPLDSWVADTGLFYWNLSMSGIKSSNDRYKLSVTITGLKSKPTSIRVYSGIFYIKNK